ncbi:MAG: hypothetical protein ACTSR2_02315 [Candidatus Hodarchaeales archaeon]
MALNLTWNQCKGDVWCGLFGVDLAHSHFDEMEGVYIIWYWQNENVPVTVRVGQGVIRDRLAQHRNDPEILANKQYNLFVTWARVAQSQRDGVERYLGETLKPKVGSRLPDIPPIEVNLPW